MTSADYSLLHHHLQMSISSLIACGDCGDMVISDSPWVHIFTELYLNLGPQTRVILSRRDASDWSLQRSNTATIDSSSTPTGSLHSKKSSTTGFFCTSSNDSTQFDDVVYHDPFSYTQCHGRADDVKKFSDPERLRDGITQYNRLVHSMVPADYLLDINLFSSSLASVGRDAWTQQNKQLVQSFLQEDDSV